MKIKSNALKIIGTFALFGGTIWCLINGLINFFEGYHAVDLAQNLVQLSGKGAQIDLNGILMDFNSYYRAGLNTMLNGFEWICFDLILFALFGYILGFLGKNRNKK